ncbi:hypothetical protein [Thalassospira marina]|uniref:Reverse transcriptase domain-containing protein n=1 Tax=Thalassospira marina TaxID=2048283 RepID=A0ABN5FUV9_9PROT|nr:hypothetical protein [Thalassospira marina]AUG55509.1 hypothetical protein CSC3H3_21865 [Thalassospira marina]
MWQAFDLPGKVAQLCVTIVPLLIAQDDMKHLIRQESFFERLKFSFPHSAIYFDVKASFDAIPTILLPIIINK